MSSSVPQVSWDARPAVSRLRRVQLYKLLEARGIPHQESAPKTQMLDLLTANGIDLNQPCPEIEWDVITGKDEQGNIHQEFYPKTEVHHSARMRDEGITLDYKQLIEEKAKANETAREKTQLAETQAEMIQMLDGRLKDLESRESELPLDRMLVWQIKEVAKQRGIDTTGIKKKADLLALLEA